MDLSSVKFPKCSSKRFGAMSLFIALVAFAYSTPVTSRAEFFGKMGYTVVFAFSESTSQYGWGWNANPDFAAQTALQGCNAFDARVVCYKKDGYLCLCWNGSKFAFGHNTDRAQNAVTAARESFQSIHGGLPSNYECRSSDGDSIFVQ